jgi:L-alanine-DL-glutamate epimerase-like enolase superfamily enzyme
MKITRVEPITLAIPFTYGVPDKSRSSVKRLDFCLVRVETDAGLVGWGEAFSYNCRNAVAAAVRDMIAPLCIGKNAAQISELGAEIQKKLHIFGRFGITAFALSGLDIALWDIAGKAANKPLHRLLGDVSRTSIPCYASLLRYEEPELVARYSARAREEGYGAIKLHEITEAALAAARRALGAGVPLMVDVNCEWSVADAIAAGRSMAPHDIAWLEEPVFPPEDLAGMRAVGEATKLAIASGENFCFASQFEALLDARAVSYAQPSVTKVGGITEFMKVIELARAKNILLAPHSPYFGPGALATLHLIAARIPEARFEHFYLQPEAWLYPAYFARDPLPLPEAPGLGFEPDAEVMRRYRL